MLKIIIDHIYQRFDRLHLQKKYESFSKIQIATIFLRKVMNVKKECLILRIKFNYFYLPSMKLSMKTHQEVRLIS